MAVRAARLSTCPHSHKRFSAERAYTRPTAVVLVRSNIPIVPLKQPLRNPRAPRGFVAAGLLRRALGEVLGERLGLVDGLLLALGVVRVVLGRRRVAGGLAAAEALAAVHLDLGGRRARERGREGGRERDKHGNDEEAEHDCVF